jgi:hypothetical protein
MVVVVTAAAAADLTGIVTAAAADWHRSIRVAGETERLTEV